MVHLCELLYHLPNDSKTISKRIENLWKNQIIFLDKKTGFGALVIFDQFNFTVSLTGCTVFVYKILFRLFCTRVSIFGR